MKQLVEHRLRSNYAKGKACHNCNTKHVVEIVDYDHVFYRCEDCDRLVEPKCDSCGVSLEITKESYICCEKCDGFSAMAERSWARSSIVYHQSNVEKTEQKIKEVEQKLKEVKQNLKEDKKKSNEIKKYYKGLLATAKKR